MDLELIKSFIRDFITMAGADDVFINLLLLHLWGHLLFSDLFPKDSFAHEVVEDISDCFLSASIMSLFCSLYVNGNIGKWVLAFGFILAIAVLVVFAKINAHLVSLRKELSATCNEIEELEEKGKMDQMFTDAETHGEDMRQKEKDTQGSKETEEKDGCK